MIGYSFKIAILVLILCKHSTISFQMRNGSKSLILNSDFGCLVNREMASLLAFFKKPLKSLMSLQKVSKQVFNGHSPQSLIQNSLNALTIQIGAPLSSLHVFYTQSFKNVENSAPLVGASHMNTTTPISKPLSPLSRNTLPN